MRRAAHVAGLVLLALLATACDKVPLFAPSQSTITLTAGQRVLALNASVEVTAVVIEPSGTPVQNGTAVRFTTSLGRVDPVEVETRNGIATTTFYAGDASGVADVRAFSGAAGNTSPAAGENATAATNTISFTIGTAAADTVTISARPSVVPSTGGTVELNAVVRGTNGQGLAGVPVTFSTTSGTLTNTIAVTDANGVATVGLTTNTEASVSAASGSKTTATAATVTVLGTPSVTLTCTGSGTGTTSCTQTVDQPMTFTAVRATGSTLLRSASLDFGNGSNTDLGTLSSSVTVTHTYRSSNPYTATLVATDINGQTTRSSVAVNITPVAVKAPVVVTFSTPTLSAATATGQLATFTITATAAGETTLAVESVTWNFGDGVTATTSGLSTSHVYDATTSNPPASTTSTRAYTVTATVRTQDGRTGTARVEIQVKLVAATP